MAYNFIEAELEMVYLDHNATTPMLPEVLAAMRPWFGVPSNPSSVHQYGQRAAVAVEEARERVAALVGGNPAGVVFTSGATEANHLCLRGAWRLRGDRSVVLMSPIEHPCVRSAGRLLQESGASLRWMGVGASGRCVLGPIDAGLAIISLMAVNHETGVPQPIEEAVDAARSVGAFLHVDAVQGVGRIPLPLSEVDGVVISSHKLGGPAGVGALILKNGDPFPPLLGGGAQERGRRAGSVNTAGVVGFGRACELAVAQRDERVDRWQALSEQLRRGIDNLGGRVIGDTGRLVPNTTCAIFGEVSGESLVQALDLRGISVSSGAACASGSLEPSPVLQAMGEKYPEGGLRVSLGWNTTQGEIETFLEGLRAVLDAHRVLEQDW
jgi:cysteine desulfurase